MKRMYIRKIVTGILCPFEVLGNMMILKLVFFVFICCVNNSVQDRLKVSLYYEGLCPYCHEFILNQLYPGYQKIGDRLEIDLIPLGHATHTKIDNKIEWACQHGPGECYINKINACAINLNSTQSQLMEFINCVIGNSTTSNTPDVEEVIASECAAKSNLVWDDINDCLNSDLSDNLELAYEYRQNKLVPKLSYVPHIRFNDKFDSKLENDARLDFVTTACKLFKIKPNRCKKTLIENTATKKMNPQKCYFNDIPEVY